VGTVEFLNLRTCQESLRTQKHVKKNFLFVEYFLFLRKF